jgi:hypothetical protein
MRLASPGCSRPEWAFRRYESTKLAFNFHRCRVRRKRQQLPPSLLIENALGRGFASSSRLSRAEAFPIKASDNPPGAVHRRILARFSFLIFEMTSKSRSISGWVFPVG